jgi:hypothetical protein
VTAGPGQPGAGPTPGAPLPGVPDPLEIPLPGEPAGLGGLGGSQGTTILLGVAALLGLLALVRPPGGLRRLPVLPAPFRPPAFRALLERPG